MKSKFTIDPPLLNSASPWATTLEDIQALYNSPYTGAVTTRTSLLEGFAHDPSVHQHLFFNAGSSAPKGSGTSTTTTDPSTLNLNADKDKPASKTGTGTSSLNTYGYSPLTLSEYLGIINEIIGQRHLGTSHTQDETKQGGPKPFILSVTGTPDELAMAYALITNAAEMDEDLRLAMEINLSCPNIHESPIPPAFVEAQLLEYLEAIGDSKSTYRGRMSDESVPRVGIKLPPFTYSAQFETVIKCLRQVQSSEPGGGSVIDFITCTNTLGGALVLDESGAPVLNSEAGTGLGGLAGAALHPIALGNVATFRKLLDQHDDTRDVMVIGVGGVEDKAGFDRMRKVGASAVACATALGRHGVDVFERITKG